MESILEQPSQPLPASRRLDSSSLHLLPCGIKHDGKANISDFFILTNSEVLTQVTSEEVTEETSTITAEGESSETTTLVCTSSTTKATTTTAASVPSTSFRGRALKGTVIQVPSNYVGSIYTHVPAPPAPVKPVKASKGPASKDMMDMDQDDYEAMLDGMQEERKTWTTTAQFDSFMLWGHDQVPTVRTDKVMKAMEWINIAEILHQPIV